MHYNIVIFFFLFLSSTLRTSTDATVTPDVTKGERFEEWCRYLYDDCSQATILNILVPSTTDLSLPPECDQSQQLTLFTKLIHLANLHLEINQTSPLTLFIPDDLAVRTSAEDIRESMALPNPLTTDEDVISIFTDHFLPKFDQPAVVLDAIIRNHMTNTPLPSCQLWITQSWTTLDKQQIYRGGVDLAMDKTQYIHPEMAIQHLPIQAQNGVIHRIDRLIMPDLTRFGGDPIPSGEII